jgi:hypothetical protein
MDMAISYQKRKNHVQIAENIIYSTSTLSTTEEEDLGVEGTDSNGRVHFACFKRFKIKFYF